MIHRRVSARRIALAAGLVLALVAISAASLINLSTAQAQRECNVRVTLLQLNDVYQFAAVDGGTRGGLARVLTLRKQIMSESPHALFLLAGDTISPSVESNTYQGKQMIDAWNTSGLDYATFGNREFDGAKIGLFGIVLQETLLTSRPGPDVDILDPCATAAKVVPKIHAAGAQIIVALTHQTIGDDKQFARCSGVDVIIGGHEHTLLESMSGHAPIFKMDADARELGRVDLNILKSTGKLESIDWQIIPVTDKVQSDPAFQALDSKYGPLMKSLAVPVGRTAVELDVKSADVRVQETNMADFVAETFRQALGADVALVNGGSIRADTIIKPGVLTKRDVLSVLPFNNRVVKLQVTGAVIRAALENGVSTAAEEVQPGRFPQVSGIRYAFDTSRPPRQRITSIT